MTDHILDLIMLHKNQSIWGNERGISGAEVARRGEFADETWWKLLDAVPTTRTEAIHFARYIAQIDEEGAAPDIKTDGDDQYHISIASEALSRIASFLEAEVP